MPFGVTSTKLRVIKKSFGLIKAPKFSCLSRKGTCNLNRLNLLTQKLLVTDCEGNYIYIFLDLYSI